MPLDTGVFDKIRTFQDYQRAEEEFQLKKQLQAAQVKKLLRPDIDEMGQQAFLKAAQGMPLSPQENAALQYADAKTQTFGFNPATGAIEQKPGLLARAGLPAPSNPVAQQGNMSPDVQSKIVELYGSDGNAPDNTYTSPNVPLTPKSKQFLQEKRLVQQAEREGNYTKAQSALQDFESKSQIVDKSISEALGLIDKPYSAATGWPSILTGGGFLPGDRRQLDNALNTIKSNIGFDKLQQMRENSPTGGALGQVSDFENRLLQAINGALDPLQGEQLKNNLATIGELYPQVLAEKRRAFEQDYGAFNPIGGNTQPPPATPNLNKSLAPKPGTTMQGTDGVYMFNGGDPTKQESWKKVK